MHNQGCEISNIVPGTTITYSVWYDIVQGVLLSQFYTVHPLDVFHPLQKTSMPPDLLLFEAFLTPLWISTKIHLYHF